MCGRFQVGVPDPIDDASNFVQVRPGVNHKGLPQVEILLRKLVRRHGTRTTLKPLDMSDAVCRKDICRAVEGNVLLYHDAHHISKTYMRTMTAELGRQLATATRWWVD